MQIIYLYRKDGTDYRYWSLHHDTVGPKNISYQVIKSNWIVPGTVDPKED